MQFSSFSSAEESHNHSLQILNLMYEYDDFMESVGRVADLGCGSEGLDMLWWATRTTRGEEQIPLNINCTGFDTIEKLNCKHKNISYQKQNIEQLARVKRGYDILWCHDTFQYMINPIQTLSNWRNVANNDAMLVLALPQTTTVQYNQQLFDVPSGHYYHYTLTNLIYMLAVSGWDCRSGFFKKVSTDPWLYAIVYKSQEKQFEPQTTSWYDLCETELLPACAVDSITKYGYLRQQDLILPWLDKSLTWMAQH